MKHLLRSVSPGGKYVPLGGFVAHGNWPGVCSSKLTYPLAEATGIRQHGYPRRILGRSFSSNKEGQAGFMHGRSRNTKRIPLTARASGVSTIDQTRKA